MSAAARRIRLDLAYDGTDFAGWQMQPGQRTVQGVVEQALSELQGGPRVIVRAAGRTDAGVHAAAQVTDCDLDVALDDARVEQALHKMLPRDVRPLRVRTTAPGFDARKDAHSKTYVYRLDLSLYGNPFHGRFALHYPWPLDLERVQEGLALLPGRRDWSGFTASACEKPDRVRTLSEARLEREAEGRARLVFTADGFLQHMVRNLVGTLLEIGGGRMPLETIGRAIQSGDRGEAGPTAAARGLVLNRIRYAED